MEKVESGGKKTNDQAQCVNLNLSRGIQELEVDTSTSKQFPPDKSLDFATISLSDPKPEVDTLTSKEILEESVLTVAHEEITVSTKLESQDLTVENETTTVSTTDQLQDLTVENQTATVSTELELTVLTVESQDLTVEHNSTTVRAENQLQDLTVENQTTTVRAENQLQDLTVENQTTTVSTNQICNKRRKGEGTGRIQLRTITKQNGKQYQQFWYDWQIQTSEKTIYKSVYIPKRLLKKIQALESAKAPVWEILEVLGVIGK